MPWEAEYDIEYVASDASRRSEPMHPAHGMRDSEAIDMLREHPVDGGHLDPLFVPPAVLAGHDEAALTAPVDA